MSTNEAPTTTLEPPPQTNRIDIALSPWQFEALFRCDAYKFVNLIGGRGSGKSYIEAPRAVRWATMTTEMYYGIFGATDTVLQTILAPIAQLVDDMGYDSVYEREAPASWRARWRRDGIKYPPRRLRSHKIWIWENGMHIVTGSLINNAVTRFKSIEYNIIYIGESTEPGVTKNAVLTLLGALRCGKATKGADGAWRCREPGHLHQMVLGGNVPLNDPGHYMYAFDQQMRAKEEKRRAEGKPPFYRLITSATHDNKFTGEDYDDTLRAAFDHETYIQQTSGRLERNMAEVSYYAFSEANVLPLEYDPARPLHIWFDFNHAPAAVGWGHDLRYDEVPVAHARSTFNYFGINGELFTGAETMQTEQVAYALLEDPTKDLQHAEARCNDCGHFIRRHLELDAESGWLCQVCAYQLDGRHCSGRAASIDERAVPGAHRFIHAAPNWRGLMRHRADIYVYGDATGKATHADASAPGGSIRILRDVFEANLRDRVHFRFRESNAPVRYRVLAVNRMLCDANGIRRLFMAPWCTAHIADFREVIPDPKKSGEPLKVPKDQKSGNDYWMRTDASDGAGYHVEYRWPALDRKTGRLLPMVGSTGGSGPLENDWPVP